MSEFVILVYFTASNGKEVWINPAHVTAVVEDAEDTCVVWHSDTKFLRLPISAGAAAARLAG